MARLVEKTIKKPLSELLLFENVADGDRIIVDVAADALTGTSEEPRIVGLAALLAQVLGPGSWVSRLKTQDSRLKPPDRPLLHRHLDVGVGPAALEPAAALTR